MFTVDIEVRISNNVQLICLTCSCCDVCLVVVNPNVQEARRRRQIVQLELGHIKDCPSLFFYALASLGNFHLLADYIRVWSFMPWTSSMDWAHKYVQHCNRTDSDMQSGKNSELQVQVQVQLTTSIRLL